MNLGGATHEEFASFCERLVVEVGVPPVQTLLNPGPLELALLRLLSEEVGVSHYPNNKRPRQTPRSPSNS